MRLKSFLMRPTGLNFLVNDLLTLAKLDAGTIVMTKSKVEINELVKNVVERFRFAIEKSKIDLQAKYAKAGLYECGRDAPGAGFFKFAG